MLDACIEGWAHLPRRNGIGARIVGDRRSGSGLCWGATRRGIAGWRLTPMDREPIGTGRHRIFRCPFCRGASRPRPELEWRSPTGCWTVTARFYVHLAKTIVTAIQNSSLPGRVTVAELAGYQTVEREPLCLQLDQREIGFHGRPRHAERFGKNAVIPPRPQLADT